MLRKLQVFFLLISVSIIAGAQQVSRQSIEENSGFLSVGQRVTALVLRTSEYVGESVEILVDGKAVRLPFDPDGPDFSYFISLEAPLENLSILVQEGIPVELFLIKSGKAPSVEASGYRFDQEACDFSFSAVAQSEWRAGLPPPEYTRSFTDVTHVVVHHSAGSNSATNYTQVVRDIYLYHTEVNGWSDIGYNYLIAQDGSIYAGRDPDGGAQDNVLGAHFCGANSLTMGICLLGNYEEVAPTAAIWSSLEQITVYKIHKENLSPTSTYPHPFGQLPSNLGHRDGCSTLCPGEHVYERLDILRSTVHQKLSECAGEIRKELSFTASELSPQVYQEVTFTNESTGYDSYQWIFEGGEPDTATGNEVRVSYFYPGYFSVMLLGHDEAGTDTALFANVVHVLGEVVVFPNPVAPLEAIHLAAGRQIDEVELIGLNGRCYPLRRKTDGTYQVPLVSRGIYVLRISTNAGFSSARKLLVR